MTTPRFLELVPRVNALAARLAPAGRAHVAVVYTREAHARDEWPVGLPYSARDAPATAGARRAAARRFADEWRLSPRVPVFVDSMDDAFHAAYAAWPVRWYVLRRAPAEAEAEEAATVAFIAQPNAALGYEFGELEAFLRRALDGGDADKEEESDDGDDDS